MRTWARVWTFLGHRLAFLRLVQAISGRGVPLPTPLERNCALVTGCSAWHKEKKQKRLGQGAPDCLCGKRFPSRPHLLWNCVETAAFVAEVPLPDGPLTGTASGL